ncbi:MAG: efflux RND transporter periplasmic adaptor subunit, partial [Verrucomicrobiae bacterium]|nr:efflux RND transporter periplasmic adaptor subunit [Verrucomicrobiae bacterium]NNJ86469.1 efflux RND transporter periplasmic adaptor subunit [Akkermansiaceae bacterium]
MRLFLHILIPLAVIFAGIMAFSGLKKLNKLTIFGKQIGIEKKSPQTSRPKGMKRPMFRTKAIPLVARDHTVQLTSQGEIRTHNATALTSQIGGRVIKISPKFQDGAFFSKNDVLLELETADYLTELANAKAQLARAEATFAQEKARAKQALLNWNDAGFTEQPSDLVLRKPQLRQAEAAVDSANSSLARAQRNLERTKVRAPYDGRVRKRNIGLGQQVGGSTPLGEIFSTDFAEVRLPLTTRDLAYYTPPQKPGETGIKDNVIFTSILTSEPENSESTTKWHGTILRAEGELDEDSRQLFVIARIDDPFALKTKATPLYIGQPVRARIPAKTLKNVYVIP